MAKLFHLTTGKRLLVSVMLAVFMAIGGFVTWMQYDLWRDLPSFKEVQGTIDHKETKVEKRRSNGRTRSRTKHKLTVHFTPAGANDPVTVTENVPIELFETKEAGDNIPVFHDPADPQRVVLGERSIGSFFSAVVLPSLFVVIPLVLLVLVWVL